MALALRKQNRGGGRIYCVWILMGREQLSQSDYIVILKIFRSPSKTLNIVTGSRVPLGRRGWSVCGGWGYHRNQTNTPTPATALISLLFTRSDLQLWGPQITAARERLLLQRGEVGGCRRAWGIHTIWIVFGWLLLIKESQKWACSFTAEMVKNKPLYCVKWWVLHHNRERSRADTITLKTQL